MNANHTILLQINTGTSQSPVWARVGAGFTSYQKAMNEVVVQMAFLSDEGYGRSEVVGGQLTLELQGKRVVGDTAQDFIFSKQDEFGDSRHCEFRITKDGKVLTGDATLTNINDSGGDSQALDEVSVSIQFNGKPSNVVNYSVTVDVTGNGDVTVDPTLAEAGDTITVTTSPDEGYRLVDGTLKANGTAITGGSFIMPEANVVVTAEFEEIPVPVGWVVGVKIDKTNSNPDTAVVYTDDAVGQSASVGNNGTFTDNGWSNRAPFNLIKPYLVLNGVEVAELNPNDFTKDVDGNNVDISSGTAGDVMIKIPLMYYSITEDTGFYYIRLASYQVDNTFTDYAHSYKGVVKNQFYVGAYHGYVASGKLRSLSGKSPTVNTTLATFRTNAKANGTGYELLPYNKLVLLQILYLIRYRNRNSQSALGLGYTSASALTTTGQTNSRGMNYGTASGTSQIKCNGIEDFWGNVLDYIDGLYIDSSGNILVDDGTTGFNNSGTGYTNIGTQASNVSGYISKIRATNKAGFMVTEGAGSETTYFTDYGFAYRGYLPFFGGSWGNGALAGAFGLRVDSGGGSLGYVGGRLALCQ